MRAIKIAALVAAGVVGACFVAVLLGAFVERMTSIVGQG
jgi:hypothetical protein